MNDTIVVLGSINYDIVARAEKLPQKGETLLGLDVETNTGGKGGNQAVQIALLGLKSVFIGQVGDDEHGKVVLASLEVKGVNKSFSCVKKGESTGLALITVAPDGSNTLVYIAGANHTISCEMIDKAAPCIKSARMLVTQNEININALMYGICLARSADIPVLHNPAPAVSLPDEIWSLLDYITPNEVEASLYSGVPLTESGSDAQRRSCADWFLERGVKNVCITLGPAGAYWTDGKREIYRPTFPIKPIDTTAAGDSFIGGFASGIVRGLTIENCLDIGNACGSLSVATKGAQKSIQGRDKILAFLREQNINIEF
jgi:ribokinase